MELVLDEFLLQYFCVGLSDKQLRAEALKICNPEASSIVGFFPGFTTVTF